MNGARLSLYRRGRRRFYWGLTRALLGLAAVVPLGLGRWVCRELMRGAVALRPREVDRARRNLALAFPEHEAARREALLGAAAAALGRNLFDALAAPRLLRREGAVISEPSASGDDVIEILAALMAGRRGVLIMTGHLGCWELLGGWLSRRLEARGLGPLAVVTGTIRNPAVDRLIQRRRRGLGLVVLPREAGVGPLLAHLRGGGAVAVLQDQNTRAGSVSVPFFGRPAPTPAGLARIAIRGAVPVLPVAIAWDPGRRCHVVRHLPPLTIPEAGGEPEAAVRTLLAAANASLEDFVRRNPDEWVWFHNRWDEADTADPPGPSHAQEGGES